MENFEEILIFHFNKYPLMKPQDAVKLVYQSAEGCGHLVKNADFAMSMLKNEMENIGAQTGARILEPIGGGYVRLYLAPAKNAGIPLEKIGEIFIESANSGIKTEMSTKMEVLKNLAKQGKAPFSEAELAAFLQGYNGEMLSHSEEYRSAYRPAYRVILQSLAENLQ